MIEDDWLTLHGIGKSIHTTRTNERPNAHPPRCSSTYISTYCNYITVIDNALYITTL